MKFSVYVSHLSVNQVKKPWYANYNDTALLLQDTGFGDPTLPFPINQSTSFYAPAQAVSAFDMPSHHQGPDAYPPPVGKLLVQNIALSLSETIYKRET